MPKAAGSEKFKKPRNIQRPARPMSTGPKPKFTPALLADAEQVLELVEKYYQFDHIEFDAAVIRGGLKTLLRNQSLGRVWLIHLQNQLVGYVVVTFGFDYEFGGRTALITDLYLEPEFRGRGLGRKTLRHVEGFCRKSRITGLELQVERKNRRAARLYRDFGFQPLPRIPMSKVITQ